MITTAMRQGAYKRIERQAKRHAAVGTGFIYNCANWGKPEYIAMTAEQRHRSFGFGVNPVIEVSSFAFAQALAAALNAGTLPALHHEYSTRRQCAFVRSEVARRNFLLGRVARFDARMRRAKRTVRASGSAVDRALALRRALSAYRVITDARRTLAGVQLEAPLLLTWQGAQV